MSKGQKKLFSLTLIMVLILSILPFSSVMADEIDASKITWYVVDHTNFTANPALIDPSFPGDLDPLSPESNTAQNLITYYFDYYAHYDEYTYAPQTRNNGMYRDRHIQISADGTDITFTGYGDPTFYDFLYSPNTTNEVKTFKFSIDEANAKYHTLQAAGFIFNALYSVVPDASPTGFTRTLTGYFIGVGEYDINLYKMVNVDVNRFNKTNPPEDNDHQLPTTLNVPDSAGFTLIESVSKTAYLTNDTDVPGKKLRYLTITASDSELTVNQYDDSARTILTNGAPIMHLTGLPNVSGSYGFGPYVAYQGSGHTCSMVTQIVFSYLTFSSPTLKPNDQPAGPAVVGRHELQTLLTSPAGSDPLRTTDMNYKLTSQEQWDPSVSKITVWVEGSPADLAAVQSIVKLAAGQTLLKATNIKVMMKTEFLNGTSTTREVTSSEIAKNLTILIPVSGLNATTDLGIVYIDANGNTALLPSTRVTVDGVDYLQFENNTFPAQYGVISTGTSTGLTVAAGGLEVHGAEIPKTGENDLYTLLGLLMLALAGIVLLKTRKARKIN